MRWNAKKECQISDLFFRKSLDSLTFFLILLVMTIKNTSTPSATPASFDPWADLSEAEFAEFETAMLREQAEREHAEAMAHEAQLERELVASGDFR